MGLEGMLQIKTSKADWDIVRFSTLLGIGLFLTSFAFNGSFYVFLITSVILILFYTLFDHLLYSDKPAINIEYVIVPTKEDATDSIERGKAVLAGDNAQNTLDLPGSYAIPVQSMYYTLHRTTSRLFCFSSALIASLGSQLLVSGCFEPASSLGAPISASIVGAVSMLVAGSYTYVSERLRHAFYLCHCAASVLGVICWLANKVTIVVINDVSNLANASTNIFTGIASTAIVLYAIRNTNVQPSTPRASLLCTLYKRVALFVLHCLVCLAVHLLTSASFDDLLSNDTLPGWAVAARVLWAAGLIGTVPLLMSTPYGPVDGDRTPQRTRHWHALAGVLASTIGMATRLCFGAGWCYTLLTAAVQFTGGFLVPMAAVVLPFLCAIAKKLPNRRLRMLAGAFLFYIVTNIVIVILSLAGYATYGCNRLAPPDSAIQSPPEYSTTIGGGIFDSSNARMHFKKDERGENNASTSLYGKNPRLSSEEQRRCYRYTNLLKVTQENSVCSVMSIETLLDSCQALYYDEDTGIAVFRHPKIGFAAIIEEKKVHAVLKSFPGSQNYGFINATSSNLMKSLGGVQSHVLIKLSSPKDIAFLLETHFKITIKNFVSPRSFGACITSYKDNEYKVMWLPVPKRVIMYTFTMKSTAASTVQTSQYTVDVICAKQYLDQLFKNKFCYGVEETLSKACVLSERENGTFDLAFQFEIQGWLSQPVNLSQIISQNNNTRLDDKGFQLAGVKSLESISEGQTGNSTLSTLNDIVISAIWERRKSPQLSACTATSFDNIWTFRIHLSNGQTYQVTAERKWGKRILPDITIFNMTDTTTSTSTYASDVTEQSSPGTTLPSIKNE